MKAGKPLPNLGKGRTTEIIAKSLGLGHTSLEKAEKLVDAAEKRPAKFRELLDKVVNHKCSLDRAYKQLITNEELQEPPRSPASPVTAGSIKMLNGDSQTQSLTVKDDSVDLIFTHPLDIGVQLDIYGWLFSFADRVLKTSASLVTYVPNHAIPSVILHSWVCARNLKYYRTFAVLLDDTLSSSSTKAILVKWKPLMWFVKLEEGKENTQTEPKPNNRKVSDLIYPARSNDVYRDHELSIENTRYIIDKLTKPDDTVCDPFMGSENPAIAALELKRRFIGMGADTDTFHILRGRVSAFCAENKINIIENW